jgi:hypothetical protein
VAACGEPPDVIERHLVEAFAAVLAEVDDERGEAPLAGLSAALVTFRHTGFSVNASKYGNNTHRLSKIDTADNSIAVSK